MKEKFMSDQSLDSFEENFLIQNNDYPVPKKGNKMKKKVRTRKKEENKSYDDSVKLKRTEMGPFRLG